MGGERIKPHSSASAAKFLSPLEKKKFVEGSFRRKVEEMERILNAALRGEILKDAWWPRDLQQLAEWEDPGSGIFKWKSKRIASPKGPHPRLYQRFQNAKHKLKSLTNGDRSKRVADENRVLKGRVIALGAQNAQLENAVRVLIDALERAAVTSEAAGEQLRKLYRTR